MVVSQNGVVRLEATQAPGSLRTYVNLASTDKVAKQLDKQRCGDCVGAVAVHSDNHSADHDDSAIAHVGGKQVKSGRIVNNEQETIPHRCGSDAEARSAVLADCRAGCDAVEPRKSEFLRVPDTHIAPATATADVKVKMRQQLETIEKARVWHSKLAHPGKEAFLHSLVLLGIKQPNEKVCSLLNSCEVCKQGNSKRKGHPKMSYNRATAAGERFHLDVFGPTRVVSVGGARYLLLVVDDKSRFVYPLFAKHKSDFAAQVVQFFRALKLQRKIVPKQVGADNAPEFNTVWKYCKEEGIMVYLTVAGESAQNGQAERFIGIIVNMARKLLLQSGGSMGFWAEAVKQAVYIWNNMPHKSTNWQVPVELIFGEKSQLSTLHTFGCALYAHVDGANKLGAQAVLGIYLGKEIGKKGEKYWDPHRHRAFVAWSVGVIEEKMPWKEGIGLENGGEVRKDEYLFSNLGPEPDPIPKPKVDTKTQVILPNLAPPPVVAPQQAPVVAPQVPPPVAPIAVPPPSNPPPLALDVDLSHLHEPDSDSDVRPPPPRNPPEVATGPRYSLRPNRGVPGSKFGGGDVYEVLKASVVDYGQATPEEEPKTHEQAMRNPNSRKFGALSSRDLRVCRSS
jgi:transposase InsO family protein